MKIAGLSLVRGQRKVLSDVSFEARAGEIFAIVGPNGAGKSTLLECIVGLLSYEGSVTVDQTDLRTLSPRERAKKVAYVPQRSDLRAALSVRDVVALGRYAHGAGIGGASDSDKDAIDDALEKLDLRTFRDRVFTRLSVGEQQRVMIARALATQAPVVVLDEPTAALDVGQSLRALSLLANLAEEGRTVVVVLHGLSDVNRYAKRAILLQEGSVAAYGTTAEVIAPKPILDVYGVELKLGQDMVFQLPERDMLE